MKTIRDVNLRHFDAWSGAKETQERIMLEGKEADFERLIEEMYPDGLTATQLNDILWFEEDWIFSQLGIEDEEDENEEEEYHYLSAWDDEELEDEEDEADCCGYCQNA